jgi:hypothetical protein
MKNAFLPGKKDIQMAFPQFAELWKLVDLLVRKDFRQANLVLARKGVAQTFLSVS